MSDKMIPNDSGLSCSPWMKETVPDLWAELAEQTYADVCIIGAGIAGLSVAYHLSRAGRNVLVIDDGPIAGGETGRTTAHLAFALDDHFYVLEKHHGEKGARLAAASHMAAIDDIEAIVHGEHIDCDFRRVDGYLFPHDTKAVDEIRKELEAARRAGVECELVTNLPLPGFQSGPALRFPRQAQFHPVKYVRGLAEAVIARGGRIVTGARAEKVEGGTPCKVIVEGNKTITAAAVVVCTNAPITSRVKIPLKQGAWRTYVIGMQVPRGTVPAALYWDTDEPYHYVRVIPGGPGTESDLLIVGGADHKTGQENDAEARWHGLAEWARQRFVGVTHVVAKWSGQVMEPADGMAFTGRDPSSGDNVYLHTGDSGNGLTHGAIAGILISDLILGRKNDWESLYDPGRSELRRAPGTYIKEAVNMAGQYADWVTGGDVASESDILPGQGAVLRRGLHLMAVYRDEAGHCHARSAVCPHLGGIVSWNPAERSWDCPAHGSRFDCLGRVMNGPANGDLKPVMEESPKDQEVTTPAVEASLEPV